MAFTLSDAATAVSDGGNGVDSGYTGSTGSGSNQVIGIVTIIFIVVMLFAIGGWAWSGDTYNGGPGIHPGAPGFYPRGFGVGHSCACACAGCACACACACAGGGRVGCSRKVIGIACLSKVIRTMTKQDEVSLRGTQE